MNNNTLSFLLEVVYLKMFNRVPSINLNDNIDLYPKEWFNISDDEFRSKILIEAINNHKKIEETEAFLSIYADGKLTK